MIEVVGKKQLGCCRRNIFVIFVREKWSFRHFVTLFYSLSRLTLALLFGRVRDQHKQRLT